MVLEIADRMTAYFPDLKVTAVCEGYPENKEDLYDSDLIVCTMHQLYRYPHSFDLLIMDEVDAFPYAGNETLQAITLRACKGKGFYYPLHQMQKLWMRLNRKRWFFANCFNDRMENHCVFPK